jgi:hypothetical protein
MFDFEDFFESFNVIYKEDEHRLIILCTRCMEGGYYKRIQEYNQAGMIDYRTLFRVGLEHIQVTEHG